MDRIKIPLLIAHGEQDRIVPVEQSRKMVKQLEASKKQVQYLELAEGTHNLSIQQNRDTFFRAMDEFLGRHLR